MCHLCRLSPYYVWLVLVKDLDLQGKMKENKKRGTWQGNRRETYTYVNRSLSIQIHNIPWCLGSGSEPKVSVHTSGFDALNNIAWLYFA